MPDDVIYSFPAGSMSTSMPLTINFVDDVNFEATESFILFSSTTSQIDPDLLIEAYATVSIMDNDGTFGARARTGYPLHSHY